MSLQFFVNKTSYKMISITSLYIMKEPHCFTSNVSIACFYSTKIKTYFLQDYMGMVILPIIFLL